MHDPESGLNGDIPDEPEGTAPLGQGPGSSKPDVAHIDPQSVPLDPLDPEDRPPMSRRHRKPDSPQVHSAAPCLVWLGLYLLAVGAVIWFASSNSSMVPMGTRFMGPRSPLAEIFWLYYIAAGALLAMLHARWSRRPSPFSTLPGYLYIGVGLYFGVIFARVMDYVLFVISLGLTHAAALASRPREARPGPRGRIKPSRPRASWISILILVACMTIPAFSFWVLDYREDGFGYALLLGIPMQAGFLFGFLWMEEGSEGWWILILGSVAAGAIAMIMLLGPFGIFCGILVSPLYFMGIFISACVGHVIRILFERRPRSLHALLVIGFTSIPFQASALDHVLPMPEGTRTLVTERVVAAPSHELWATKIFTAPYGTASAAGQALAVPRPQDSAGRSTAVGDRKRFEYAGGHLLIRIQEVVDGRRLEFRVEEQVGVENRAVRLLGGRLLMQPEAADRTRLRLELDYQPRLRPRFIGWPYERAFGTLILDEVLREIEQAWLRRQETRRN